MRALGHARAPQATQHLLAVLQRPDVAAVHEHAIWGLQALADPAAIDVLIDQILKADYHYNHPAELALVAIGRVARDPLLAAKDLGDADARERIDWVLTRIK